ncbi:MAG: branched-chain amino acid ABC transporter permease [Oligoflexia bacterium]|nr:branched-chain amino acid ABC transporter permease [Oligoflexia bacterium]
MEYFIHLLILICMYLILAQSFNLTFGMGRLFNLAHVAAFAIGSYAAALLSTELGLGFWKCILFSMLCSGLFAFLIGAISLRLAQDYFAIGTLAFSSVINALLVNWKSLTRGVLGIPGIPRPEIFGIDFTENINFLGLIFVFVVLTHIIFYILFNNSFARRLKGQAEFDYACSSLGCNTKAIRNWSFLVASACAGLSGAFFAYYISYIDPSSFALNQMIFVLTISVVGSPGSFWGGVASTIFLVLLPEPLRWIDIPPSILGPMRQFIYASILFAVVWWKREKLFPVQRGI